MSEDFVYQTDIGAVIHLNILERDTGVAVVITGATGVTIEVKKPSGAMASWPGVVGADNKSVEHTIAANDLDELGSYLLQPQFTLGGWSGRGRPAMLDVRGPFK